ncbi:toxin TcdB middle/N-terminal domain-containing protein [Sorangium sp. So ce124]|uniref:toxin TcdB middle/N-terminal domain-containing protein n=1 Tax=Sorangium sp. So ce124 TaxID=3133280 RepID=UPI003F62488F
MFYFEGSGSSHLAFEDIDGDCLADHVLNRDGDAKAYARVNAIGKADLLRQANMPLCGSVELDYMREGNLVLPSEGPMDEADGAPRVDMPSSQWVLSAVTLRDGWRARGGTRRAHVQDAHRDVRGCDRRSGRARAARLRGGHDDGARRGGRRCVGNVGDVGRAGRVPERQLLPARVCGASKLRDGDGLLYTIQEITSPAAWGACARGGRVPLPQGDEPTDCILRGDDGRPGRAAQAGARGAWRSGRPARASAERSSLERPPNTAVSREFSILALVTIS